MTAYARLFQIELQGHSGAPLCLEGGQNFSGAEPFYLTANSTTWHMPVADVTALHAAVQRADFRLQAAYRKGAQPKDGALFVRRWGGGDVVTIELGTVDGDVYFEFAGIRIALDDKSFHVLAGAIAQFRTAVSGMRRASNPPPARLERQWWQD